MRRSYSKGFKSSMIQRMTGPNPMSGHALAKEVGVPQSLLSKWLREAGMPSPFRFPRSTKEASMSRRPEDRPTHEKMQIVLAAAGLSDEDLGAFLRKEGIHSTHLERWQGECVDALKPKRENQVELKKLKRENKRLVKELSRKDAALAETAALLVLQKKVQVLWGDEDKST